MKTKEQYFKEIERRHKKRFLKYCRELAKEIDNMNITQLKWKLLIKTEAHTFYSDIDHFMWSTHETCRFCGLEYIEGLYTDCCDDCFEKNKDKKLEELI